MRTTRQLTARRLADYSDGKFTLESLVEWAEDAMMDGVFFLKTQRFFLKLWRDSASPMYVPSG